MTMTPTNLLLIDTETTGLDDSAQCIEVACVVYNLRHAAVVRSFSSLIQAVDNAAESLNRIPAALLAEAPPASRVWATVAKFVEMADCLVAHGAEFDQRFVPAAVVSGKQWVCSMDLAWPRQQKPGESLVKLALAHDLGVSSAHRAAVDCDLLARLLTRVRELGVDLDAFIARGLRPKARFVVAARDYDPARNEQAKEAGFRWEPARKEWWRVMAVEDTAALPFDVQQVDAAREAS